ncbi:hypothetical protein DFS34DRAFT_668506 [Phlyctochytrium arcticum]|nr:hypothetical protein DFS34DRAFT_668506 [Phlyctochytrium arcticum]
MYNNSTESWRLVTGLRPGGWHSRLKCLTAGTVVQLMGELLSMREFLIHNFFLTGAKTKVPSSSAASGSMKRDSAWGKKIISTAAAEVLPSDCPNHPSRKGKEHAPKYDPIALPPTPLRTPSAAPSDTLATPATPATPAPKKRGRPRKSTPPAPPPPTAVSDHGNTETGSEGEDDEDAIASRREKLRRCYY